MAVKLLTKSVVETMSYSEGKVLIFYDTRLKGFGLRVSGRVKAYFAEGRVKGKTRRVKIGAHEKGDVPEDMRIKAKKVQTEMTDGIDPNAKKRQEREQESITLQKCLDDYLERGSIKQKTVRDYRAVFKNCFKGWAERPMQDISKEAVTRKYRTIGDKTPAYANLAMRLLRALYGYAEARYGGITENPVKVISQTRSWYKIERRRTLVKSHDLPAFFKGLKLLDGEKDLRGALVADYIRVLLFTGLRRNEASGMQWKDVDFKAKTFTIPLTKNGHPLTLPMSKPLLEIFRRRQAVAGKNEYVFSVESFDRPLADPRNELEQARTLSGVSFTYHDLRRSFASIAEAEVSAYQLKRMLNHSMGGDVTAGYIISDVESLRIGMERVARKIQNFAEGETGKLIELTRREKWE